MTWSYECNGDITQPILFSEPEQDNWSASRLRCFIPVERTWGVKWIEAGWHPYSFWIFHGRESGNRIPLNGFTSTEITDRLNSAFSFYICWQNSIPLTDRPADRPPDRPPTNKQTNKKHAEGSAGLWQVSLRGWCSWISASNSSMPFVGEEVCLHECLGFNPRVARLLRQKNFWGLNGSNLIWGWLRTGEGILGKLQSV